MARFALGPQKMQSPSVDLASTQTITGPKTFAEAVTISRGNGQLRYLELKNANAAGDYGRIENNSSNSGQFALLVTGRQATHANGGALNLVAEVDPSQDALGGAPSIFLRTTLSSGSPLTARPLLGLYDGSIYRLRVLQNGLVDFICPAQAGGETLAQWRISDSLSNTIALSNGSAAAGVFAPRILAQATDVQQVTWDTQGATDTGSSPLSRNRAYISGTGAATVRPTHGWYNDSRQDMHLTAAGDLRLLQGGRGLVYAAGAGALVGRATLVAGTVTVACPWVDASTEILLTRRTAGGAIGDLTYTINPGVGFTINSASGTDTSTISYKAEKVA